MHNLFMVATLICLVFCVWGFVISLGELLKFIQAEIKASQPVEDKMPHASYYKRKARAHRNEFIHVLSLTTGVTFMFFILLVVNY